MYDLLALKFGEWRTEQNSGQWLNQLCPMKAHSPDGNPKQFFLLTPNFALPLYGGACGLQLTPVRSYPFLSVCDGRLPRFLTFLSSGGRGHDDFRPASRPMIKVAASCSCRAARRARQQAHSRWEPFVLTPAGARSLRERTSVSTPCRVQAEPGGAATPIFSFVNQFAD